MKTPNGWMEDIVTDRDFVPNAKTALESIGAPDGIDVSVLGAIDNRIIVERRSVQARPRPSSPS